MAVIAAFSERTLQLIADHKILAAIEAGEFDNLPGMGKPSPLIDEPYDQFWWVRRVLRAEQLPVDPADGWLG